MPGFETLEWVGDFGSYLEMSSSLDYDRSADETPALHRAGENQKAPASCLAVTLERDDTSLLM